MLGKIPFLHIIQLLKLPIVTKIIIVMLIIIINQHIHKLLHVMTMLYVICHHSDAIAKINIINCECVIMSSISSIGYSPTTEYQTFPRTPFMGWHP